MLGPLAQIEQRLAQSREDSDVAFFYELLNAGEMAVKLLTAAMVACLEPDRERHQYRLEYQLVRADGLGTWSAALDDVLTGPASQVLAQPARVFQRELTQVFRLGSEDWQARSIESLHQARSAIDDAEEPSSRVSGRRWVADFAALRNRTRGHGATTAAACSAASRPLHESVMAVLANLSVFRLPWAHVRRNLSGKYRVTDLGTNVNPFHYLRSENNHSVANGIYLWADEPHRVGLLSTDDDVRDFYLPNGGFNGRRYELLSYITDSRISTPIDEYQEPPGALPSSETQGLGELEVVGNVFSNLPSQSRGYVRRDVLEEEIASVLRDDRHPVITLVGRGGIGKTSLALEVLHTVAQSDRFFSIVWFSARDIELLPEGPKLVRPHVLTPSEIAEEYTALTRGADQCVSAAQSLDEFAAVLAAPGEGASLFVFDNFETVRSPAELYRWLDTHVRTPNKILITSRSRDFKGDFWIEVGGMLEGEFAELAQKTSVDLGISQLVDADYVAELYRESDGHPYVAKVLLGAVARAGERQKVARIMASQDRVLEALFERTFSQLTPAAQRIFLTLSNWRSLVPMVALEAAVNRPQNERLDVEAAVDELRRSSLMTASQPDDSDRYLSVPLSAALFGRRKQITSPWQAAIEADTEFLRLFGPVQESGVRHGFAAQIGRLFQNVAERLQHRPGEFERYRPVLEFVAHEQPVGWILFAQLLEEHRPIGWLDDVADAYRRYLEELPDDGQIWRQLARVCRQQNDYLGSVQALIQRARLPEAVYADLSYAATRINTYLFDGVLEVDTDEKRILISALAETMERRRAEANATDLSRLAWLLMHIKRFNDAKLLVVEGLALDATNSHLQKLAVRLKISNLEAPV